MSSKSLLFICLAGMLLPGLPPVCDAAVTTRQRSSLLHHNTGTLLTRPGGKITIEMGLSYYDYYGAHCLPGNLVVSIYDKKTKTYRYAGAVEAKGCVWRGGRSAAVARYTVTAPAIGPYDQGFTVRFEYSGSVKYKPSTQTVFVYVR